MRRNKLHLLLILLFVTKAVLFCLVLRPWLGPDEAIRFEFARLFVSSGFRTLTPQASEPNQGEILRSLTSFKAWYFMDLQQPDEAGHRSFMVSPFRKDTASTTYPPLYYLLLGNFWRSLGFQDLLPQLYSGRLVSLALSVLQLLLLVKLARRAWPYAAQEVRLCALVFMAFLPQWGYLSSSVHSDNWSNLLAAGILLEFLILVDGPPHGSGGGTGPVKRFKFYVPHLGIFLAMLLMMALSTRATTIVAVSLGLCVVPLSVQRIKKVLPRHRKALLLAFAALVVAALFGIFFEKNATVPKELQEAVGRGLMQRGASIPTEELGTIVTRMGEVTPANMLRSLIIIFSTFWLALGTLVYKLSPGWLFVLAVVSAVCVFGWLRRPTFLKVVKDSPTWLLFWIVPITTVAAVLYLYGPHQPYAPEGRYLLLALPAIAILMAEGWRRCFQGEALRIGLAAWMCGWLFLDGIVLFKYLIPLYYL